MTAWRSVAGSVEVTTSREAFAGAVSLLSKRFRAPALFVQGHSPHEADVRFPVFLTFREARRLTLLEHFKPSLLALVKDLGPKVLALAQAAAVNQPGLAAVVQAIRLLATDAPEHEQGTHLSRYLSGKTNEPPPTVEELKIWLDEASLPEEDAKEWRGLDSARWSDVLTAVRTSFAATSAPASVFELTQLSGWMNATASDNTYPFDIRGVVRHEHAIYEDGGRFDVLGPDGSQLATKWLDSATLAAYLNAPGPHPVVVDDDINLEQALERLHSAVAVAEQTEVIRGRVWTRGGRSLANKTLALFAPPKATGDDDCCCGSHSDDESDPCTCPSRSIDAPTALAVGATDANGYFELPLTAAPPNLPRQVIVHVAGVCAGLAVSLDVADPEQPRFPKPMLIQVDDRLLVGDEEATAVRWTDDSQDCGCNGGSFGDAKGVVEEFSSELVIRTTDPLIARVPYEGDGTVPTPAPLPADYFRVSLGRGTALEWDREPLVSQAVTVAHGRLLTIRQVWRADGYSLGDLLYSLPLAPLQKKNIAVVDWGRTDAFSRTDDLTASESLSNVVNRERDIAEIVQSTLSERTAGRSDSGSSSGSSGGGGFLGVVFGGTSSGGASAWSSSSAESLRSVASNFVNRLRDRTAQAASAYRSQRMTTVQQVNQSERTQVVTETVANRNACHAITIQYFEVLRHFSISFEVVAARECLFVPLPITRFTVEKVARWATVLTAALPTDDLKDDLRVTVGPAQPGTAAPVAQGLPTASGGRLRVSLSIRMPAVLAEGQPAAVPSLDAYPAEKATLLSLAAKDRGAYFDDQVAPKIFKQLMRNLTVSVPGTGHALDVAMRPSTAYAKGEPLTLVFAEDAGATAIADAETVGVSIAFGGTPVPDVDVTLHEFELHAESASARTTYVAHSPRGYAITSDPVLVTLTRSGAQPATAVVPAEERRRRLLAHLNEFIEYYHKVIWSQMDADRRFALLDGVVAPNSGGRSVASVVENRLVGLVGNSLVLPVTPGLRLDRYRDDAGNGQSVDLLELYDPGMTPSVRVSVPTRGVFAESVMGRCNSCEKVDDTRNWRYWEHPLPDEPTAIEPIATTSRSQPVNTTQAAPLPPIINQVQNTLQPAPDPSGLAGVLNLLGTPNVFRDSAGLQGTQESARAALAQTYAATTKFGELAAEALMQEKEMAAKALAAYFGGVPIMDSGPKVKDSIAKDAAAGRITTAQAQDATAKVNDAMAEALSPRPSWPAESGDITAAIANASKRGAPISVSRGDSRVDLGASAPEAPSAPATSRLPWPFRLWAPASASADVGRPDNAERESMAERSLFDGLWGGLEALKGASREDFFDSATLRQMGPVRHLCSTKLSRVFANTGLDFVAHRDRDKKQTIPVILPNGTQGRSPVVRRGKAGDWLYPGAQYMASALAAEVTPFEKMQGSEFMARLGGRRGVVFFRDYWGDNAAGDHIDVWDGQNTSSDSSTNGDYAKSKEVWFWPMASLLAARRRRQR